MNFLFLFMDGVGLGPDDPRTNPFSKTEMPNLMRLLDGNRLVEGITPIETERITLLALDSTLGVPGMPQSATGQATLLTGKNVAEIVGEHYGPKPNQPVRDVLHQGTLFSTLIERGYTADFINSYPEGYFKGINSGKRLYSAIPEAATHAGIRLKNTQDLYDKKGVAADFTGEGWRTHLGYTDTPVMEAHEAGIFLAQLSTSYDFAFFEYWPSDYAGHRQDYDGAVGLMESFDGVLGGLLEAWEDDNGLILITSDHGNMEDLGTRRHTMNQVPALVMGAPELRSQFTEGLMSLVDVAPAILKFYT
jgi:hypothetical protein